MEEKQRRSSLWFFLAVMVGLILVQSLLGRLTEERLSYSEFKTLMRAGKVSDLVIEEHHISGAVDTRGIETLLSKERVAVLKRTNGVLQPFSTTRVDDPELVRELEAAKINFAGRVPNTWMTVLLSWVLPMLLLFMLWSFLLRRLSPRGGLMAIGRSKARVYVEHSTGVTFADVAGIEEAKAELMEIVDFLKNPERYRRLGGKIPKGVLLLGAPGTGKTLLAKAVAGEAKVPFFSLSGSDFVEMFVGVGAARVRDLFLQAQGVAPSIIFIDELDALGKMRSAAYMVGGHEEREQTLNQLLAEMDGFDTQKGLIIMAATNRPEILDPALLRPGRFDRKVVIDRPDVKGRQEILRVHTRAVVLGPDVSLADVAARTPGFVGADLANIVNEAALRAARMEKPAVDMSDFEEAIDRVVAGLERKSRVLIAKEKEIVAHHEAGHALLAELRPHADRVAKISIIPRGLAALGFTRQQATEDRYLLTHDELLDRLDVLLGGRVAEELIFGDVSTGAHDDLQRASDLARDMVARFGMSEAVGLATYEGSGRAQFLDIPAPARREVSEATAKLIDTEVRRLLNEAHARAYATLSKYRTVLQGLGRLLMEREVVDREALQQLLQPATAAAGATPAAA
ncbi:MAG TPA: ATP-dependent zinc metalloprotease FtsH [Gemmatimonadaceae bacterium]|jgi:cell division protease FtsH